MRKIAVLDQNTIDKIAAGEVVERPSSVVKELVENAIDAGATAVTVEITDGGKKLIRITDNGSGMEADQIPLAFLRHATSKIEKVEDLEHISSLGFRGEALSSIAAVSQVELITKTPTAMSGSRYIIEGGREHSLEELGAPEGTTFLVRNLFYNTPARSKFLKSDMTEGNYIHTLMEQLALSHPEISFKYIQNRQVKLHTSGNYNVRDVIYSVYGREIARALLEVELENSFMKISGFVGKPEIARGNRSFENYYINGRYVKNNIITKAIENAYKGFLMQHKFPFVSLRMEMDGNDLDVNVHPAKREVRFAREQEVYDAVYDTVRNALTGREMIPKVSAGKAEVLPKAPAVRTGQIPEPFEAHRRDKMYGTAALSEKPVFSEKEEKMFRGTLRQNTEEEAGQTPEEETIQQNPAEETASQIPAEEPEQKHTGEENIQQYVQAEKVPWNTEETIQKSTSENPELQHVLEDTVQKHIPEETAPQHDMPEESLTEHRTGEAPLQHVSEETSYAEYKQNVVEKAAGQDQKTAMNNQKNQPEKAEPAQQLELFEEKLLSPESRSRIRVIGQVFDTYWLVEFEDSFYIIDQHAAHEKVNYERMVRQFREHSIDSQYLSPPLIVSLNMQEENILNANLDYFRQFGFEIENFGGREYCISAVPSNLYGLTEEELFLEMLDNLSADGSRDTLDVFASRLATMSCKAAVKGNNRLSFEEAERLIDELLKLENPYHCPHGRPTIIRMTKTELEKKFKRIV